MRKFRGGTDHTFKETTKDVFTLYCYFEILNIESISRLRELVNHYTMEVIITLNDYVDVNFNTSKKGIKREIAAIEQEYGLKIYLHMSDGELVRLG